MPMQLILTQDVDHLGKAGELVTVKPGYGRNFLLPRGMAISATTRNVSRLKHERGVIERRVAKRTAEAEGLAARINGMTLQFERLTGEDEKLYGSVSSKDIATQLAKAGIKVDHRKIVFGDPIKALGKYEVEVKIHPTVKASLKFWVVGKDKEE